MSTENEVVRARDQFYFPLLFLTPDPDLSSVASPTFALRRRLWDTSTFDLATLGTKHALHLPYQLMDILLARCNLELRIEAASCEQATDELSALLLGLYAVGVSPTIAPFVTTYSINDYSGINSRDSEVLRAKLPADMQEGLTSECGTVEAWPVHLSLHCHLIPEALSVRESQFQQAADKAKRWLEMERVTPVLRVVREAAQAAPLLPSTDQSLLHVWCAIEALFPAVSTEVSFRIALYLASLADHDGDGRDIFKSARRAYNLRSRVAHGSRRDVTKEEWQEAWHLLIGAANAIIEFGALPSEDDLLDRLLRP